MKNIYFFKPIILSRSLSDMCGCQKELALELLSGRQLLAYTQNGLEVYGRHERADLPDQYFYGSEAVLLFRQSLGLPDVSIRMLDVDSLLSAISDYDTLRDIVDFLEDIEFTNGHAARFPDTDGSLPAVSEYLELQELVECLQDNGHRPVPVPRRQAYRADNDIREKRISLMDIGISLLPAGKEDPAPAGTAHKTAEKQLLDHIFGKESCPYEN